MKSKDITQQILLPEEVRDLCGFTEGERLELHAAEAALVILKAKMTAMDIANAIEVLSEIASALTVALAAACGFCDNCGDGAEASEHPGGIRIPEAILSDARISEDSKLMAYVNGRRGEVTVTQAEHRYDLTDVPPGIRSVLAMSGVCLMELDELVKQEEIIYGN